MDKHTIDKWLNKIADAGSYDKIGVIESAPDEAQLAMFEKMKIDSAYFALVCMKHIHPYIPKHHKNAFAAFDNPDLRDICQVWYRGAGKTTVKRTKIIHNICFQHRRYMVLISETIRQAKACSGSIMREIENNEVIRFIFGNLVGKTPWGVEHMMFANGVQLTPRGTKDSIRGANVDADRPDEFWLDDFEGEKNSDTLDKREALIDWLIKVVRPSGSPNRTRFCFLGTIVNKEAFLNKQNPNVKDHKGELTIEALNSWFRPEKKGFYTEFTLSKIPYDGTTDNIEPTWPEWQSLQFIKDEFDRYNSINQLAGYYQEYYNVPASESNPAINVDMISEIDCELKYVGKKAYLKYPNGRKEICRIYVGVDPAITTGPNSDDTVIFVLGLLPNEKYIILDIVAEKIKIEDQPLRVLNMMIAYSPYAVVMECVAYQLSLYEQVKKLCRDRHMNFLIYPIDKKISKKTDYMRIDGLCHVINTGKTSVIRGCENYLKFRTQARAYSSGSTREHDDTLDGFALALHNNYFPPEVDVNKLIEQTIRPDQKKQVKSFMAI